MNILIAGGSGFLGSALTRHLTQQGHAVHILTRQAPRSSQEIQWDARTTRGWTNRLAEMDAVVNLTGYGLDHWPWTERQKQKFVDSRVIPGFALAEAFEKTSQRPGIFVQTSGINYYGLHGVDTADESTPPADDFLAQLAVRWEGATQTLENLGVRRVITRISPVLARRGGLFQLMAFPVRLFFGGKLGDGTNSQSWIHLNDYVRAVTFLLENDQARGPYNLIAPQPTSGEVFMRSIAQTLGRPFWFHLPAWLLRIPLGEMSVTLTEGRFAKPARLLEQGFQFQFGDLNSALRDLLI